MYSVGAQKVHMVPRPGWRCKNKNVAHHPVMNQLSCTIAVDGWALKVLYGGHVGCMLASMSQEPLPRKIDSALLGPEPLFEAFHLCCVRRSGRWHSRRKLASCCALRFQYAASGLARRRALPRHLRHLAGGPHVRPKRLIACPTRRIPRMRDRHAHAHQRALGQFLYCYSWVAGSPLYIGRTYRHRAAHGQLQH